MEFSSRPEPPTYQRNQDCDPPVQTPREAPEMFTPHQSRTGAPPEDTRYVSHPDAVPREVVEREASNKKFEKAESSTDHSQSVAPSPSAERSLKGGPRSTLDSVLGVTGLSGEDLFRFVEYFGKEPMINSLLRSPGGQKIINDLLRQSKRLPFQVYLEPFQKRLVARLRDKENWLVSMPPPKCGGDTHLVPVIAEISRWRIDTGEDTKTVIMVQSAARGHKVHATFRGLGFNRAEFLPSAASKRPWKKMMKSLDVLIILSDTLLVLLTAGQGNFEDLDILAVDECENAYSMQRPNQVLGLLKKQIASLKSHPQIIGLTMKSPSAERAMNLKHLRKNMFVEKERVLILNRNGGEKWEYRE
ncbi:hypothetical protein BSKO_11023 [Bryopsis sp. KO-2023]|nr:hypothetical protein BSKO_11023 [Bryopsis sp. KO-2023]